ncbi:hypothetical protein QFZ99_001984 [Paraburkholderia atlantica]|uniref:hypothetical protein n=1 Tax=Paraburkholderia atlantica TaxID=2654982 RepID=UPI003D1BC22B
MAKRAAHPSPPVPRRADGQVTFHALASMSSLDTVAQLLAGVAALPCDGACYPVVQPTEEQFNHLKRDLGRDCNYGASTIHDVDLPIVSCGDRNYFHVESSSAFGEWPRFLAAIRFICSVA